MIWRDLPPLSALRAFAAYAETGGLQKAGDALNVSHAAISQQIRNLETRLGLTLLDRKGRQAQLTPEGRILAEALASGFGEIANVVAQLTGQSEARALTISTTPSFAANWLVPRLADFRARSPEVDVVIDANPALVDIGASGVDAVIRFGTGMWPEFDVLPVLATRMVAVAAPSLVGSDRPENLSDLARFALLQEVGTSESSLWLERHGLIGAGRGGKVLLPGNMTIEAARLGQGISVLAEVWVKADIEAGRLIKLFEDPVEYGYFLLTKTGIQRSALRSFVKWIKGEATR